MRAREAAEYYSIVENRFLYYNVLKLMHMSAFSLRERRGVIAFSSISMTFVVCVLIGAITSKQWDESLFLNSYESLIFEEAFCKWYLY